jgi:homospermidine synthase
MPTPKMAFSNKIVMIGFGSIGKALLPILFQNIDIKPSQITIISNRDDGLQLAKQYGIQLIVKAILVNNLSIIETKLNNQDFLLNLSVDISSLNLIELARKKGAIYLDLSTEPWKGEYKDHSLSPALRTNYALREAVLDLKDTSGPTALITHGANPGLVSHFVKQALINLRDDTGLKVADPKTRLQWATLANLLQIKTIHIAEHDTQTAPTPKRSNEFRNTWSIDGFIEEACQPAELGWGTHERHLPLQAQQHTIGSLASIYLERPGASVRVRSWCPTDGPFHGFLITHAESISIADYLSLKDNGVCYYRPTVHYAYLPAPDAVLSLYELQSNEWQAQTQQKLLLEEINTGSDELGVLLMGNPKGAYWYGSTLTIDEARKIAPQNNATTLQVVAGCIAGIIWSIEHPYEGIVEPDDIDYQYCLKIASPYLGKLAGYYTDWTPLKNRAHLFAENLDYEDPWQFNNIHVK